MCNSLDMSPRCLLDCRFSPAFEGGVLHCSPKWNENPNSGFINQISRTGSLFSKGSREKMQQPDSVQLPKIEDFYDLSYESGEIHLRGEKGRAFMRRTKAWATLRTTLSRLFKENAAQCMSHGGDAVGISFVEQTQKLEGKPKKLLR